MTDDDKTPPFGTPARARCSWIQLQLRTGLIKVLEQDEDGPTRVEHVAMVRQIWTRVSGKGPRSIWELEAERL